MTRLTLDPVIQRQLTACGEQVVLCDIAGRTLGYFVPAEISQTNETWMSNAVDRGGISTEELIRRLEAL